MTVPVASPCINVCQMDEATGWCAGCLRTLDEIACWSLLDNLEKQAVCDELEERRVQWHQRQVEQGQAEQGQAR
ncbi:MAG: DUF1289 domain-containing protein [Rubrivivax sp.]|nr:DUF1289 domain-containing protein [Rubrivivax sp.]MDP3223558.1 DUF1289 domain-containing protein [Rubrivivax sp.]